MNHLPLQIFVASHLIWIRYDDFLEVVLMNGGNVILVFFHDWQTSFLKYFVFLRKASTFPYSSTKPYCFSFIFLNYFSECFWLWPSLSLKILNCNSPSSQRVWDLWDTSGGASLWQLLANASIMFHFSSSTPCSDLLWSGLEWVVVGI